MQGEFESKLLNRIQTPCFEIKSKLPKSGSQLHFEIKKIKSQLLQAAAIFQFVHPFTRNFTKKTLAKMNYKLIQFQLGAHSINGWYGPSNGWISRSSHYESCKFLNSLFIGIINDLIWNLEKEVMTKISRHVRKTSFDFHFVRNQSIPLAFSVFLLIEHMQLQTH